MTSGHLALAGSWTNWPADVQSTVLGTSFLNTYAHEIGGDFLDIRAWQSRLEKELGTRHGIKDKQTIAEYGELGRAALYGWQIALEFFPACFWPIAARDRGIQTRNRQGMVQDELRRCFFVSLSKEDVADYFSWMESNLDERGIPHPLPFDGVVCLFGFTPEQRELMTREADSQLEAKRKKKKGLLTEADVQEVEWSLWEELPFIKRVPAFSHPQSLLDVSFYPSDGEETTFNPPAPAPFNFLMSRAAKMDLLAEDACHPATSDGDWEEALDILVRFVENDMARDAERSAERTKWKKLAAEAGANKVYVSYSDLFANPERSVPRLSPREETLIDLATARLKASGPKHGDAGAERLRAVAEELSSRSGMPQPEVLGLVEAADWILAAKTNLAAQLQATQWLQRRREEKRGRLLEEIKELQLKTGKPVAMDLPSLEGGPADRKQAVVRRLAMIAIQEPELFVHETLAKSAGFQLALARAIGFRLAEDGMSEDGIEMSQDEALRIAVEFLEFRKKAKWDCRGDALERPAFAPLKDLTEEKRENCLDSVLDLAERAARDWPRADLYAFARLARDDISDDLPAPLTLVQSAELLADALQGVLSAKRSAAAREADLEALARAESELKEIDEEHESNLRDAEEDAGREGNAAVFPAGWTLPEGVRPGVALAVRLAAKEIKGNVKRLNSHFGEKGKERREKLVRLACTLAEKTDSPVFEVHALLQDMDRAFWEEMLLPSEEEEARATMKRPLKELENELRRHPDFLVGSNAVLRLAAEWSERYGIDSKWFLGDMERLAEAVEKEHAEREAALVEREAVRLAGEKDAGSERNRASAIRILMQKGQLSEEDATRMFDSAFSRWSEFQKAVEGLRDEIGNGEHPEAAQQSFAETWARSAARKYDLPFGKIEPRTQRAVEKGLETWRENRIQAVYEEWRRAGIVPGTAEKEEAAERIARETGEQYTHDILACWTIMDEERNTAELTAKLQESSIQNRTVEAVAVTGGQTEPATGAERGPEDGAEVPERGKGADGPKGSAWWLAVAAMCLLGVGGACLAAKRRRRHLSPDVFICYRRENGREIARALQLALKTLGYRVFFDYNSIQNGKFNEKIIDAIRSTRYFVLILTNGSLERCSNEGDWVRLEIESALACQKPIVPVCPTGHVCSFPEVLPPALEPLRTIQISELNMETLFEESVRKISEQRIPL